MNFCSKCGSDNLIKKVPPGDNRPRAVCGNCATVHYRNPKVVAGCLPVWEGKVLLAKRAIEPRKGLWNIPAGFMEIGESVEAGAMREVWEEAEARVKLLGLLAVFTYTSYDHVYVHFLGELVDGKYGVGEESLEVELFSEEEIPWDQIAFESSTFALKKYFADRKNGTMRAHYGAV
ncbi:MAG TPA: NUDIX hydrolase [Bacteroidetes bacterium]|nr:NUDIX hydrolase [Bacteroidota bacterium]